MISYLKKSLEKFFGDVLSKAIYDIFKYIILFVIAWIGISILPDNFSIGKFLQEEITIRVSDLILIVFSCVILAIFIYFLMNKKQLALLKRDLYVDNMTGLLNGKALIRDIKKAIEWALANDKTFSILLFDIDDFSKLNNDFSTAVGDDVIIKLGSIFNNDKQNTDTVYREYNKGDEFIYILRETTFDKAESAAISKHKRISGRPMDVRSGSFEVNVTLCCGVTEFNPKLDKDMSVVLRATKAMRRAKAKPGKNSIESII